MSADPAAYQGQLIGTAFIFIKRKKVFEIELFQHGKSPLRDFITFQMKFVPKYA